MPRGDKSRRCWLVTALSAGGDPRDGARNRLYFLPIHRIKIGVVAGQQRIKRGAVERRVVVQPAPHDRVDLACEVGDVVTRSCGAAAIGGSAR